MQCASVTGGGTDGGNEANDHGANRLRGSEADDIAGRFACRRGQSVPVSRNQCLRDAGAKAAVDQDGRGDLDGRAGRKLRRPTDGQSVRRV
jgi:hypothetical protein